MAQSPKFTRQSVVAVLAVSLVLISNIIGVRTFTGSATEDAPTAVPGPLAVAESSMPTPSSHSQIPRTFPVTTTR